MNLLSRKNAEKGVAIIEISAFTIIILIIWLNELIDIPHLMLGAQATPPNWRESIFESVCVGILGISMVYLTRRIFQRLRSLEGILPLCAFCKKIRDDDDNWHPIETYISERSEAGFSHGICPACAEKFYPGMNI